MTTDNTGNYLNYVHCILKILKCVFFPFEMLYLSPEVLFILAGLFSCSQMSLHLLDWKLLGGKFPPSQLSRFFVFSLPCKSTTDIFGQCSDAASSGRIVWY